MAFLPEQLPVLVPWAAALCAAALLLGLLALILTTRTARPGGGPLIRFMASNAFWAASIAVVMLPMAPVPRALVFHAIWIGAAFTTAMWIRAILAFVERDDRPLLWISNILVGIAALIFVDGLAVFGGASFITLLQPMENPGLMPRAAGNQISFGPGAAVVGLSWGLLVLVASVLLARRVRADAPGETLLLVGVGLTGIVSVLDGATATLENAVALSFAANLVEAVVLTAAQVRRVSQRLAEVERASQEQQARLTAQLTQLRDLQRLSTLGEQTARISHDLRNPLTVVLTGVDQLEQMLLEAGRPKAEVEELSALTRKALERTLDLASGVTRSVRHADAAELFDVGACVEDALLLCSRSLEGVRVEVEQSPARVLGQSAELTQVLVNLFQNAADAVSELADPWVQVRVETPPEVVVIDVVDAGRPPPEHVLERMFHTPFTTKGDGTGLGLDICRHVVTGMGGAIRVVPDAPHTTIRITLPRHAAPALASAS